MAVIKDVARLAGVSTATVTKVINRPDTVKGSTRAKVQDIMRQLDYTPDPIAQGMRTKRTNNIAVLSADIRNPFFAELYSSLSADIQKNGFTPILYTIENKDTQLSDIINDILVSRTDGMVFCFPDDYVDIGKLLSLNNLNVPFVLISWDIQNSKYPSIIVDVYDGMHEAAMHLIHQGHKYIAFVGGPENSRISKEKFQGYMAALKESDLDVPDEYICSGDYSLKTGYLSARHYMHLDHPPTAIMCANDILAIGCMKYLLNSGIDVPKKVAVSGFDNISIASMYEPALTTVSIPVSGVSGACAEMITDMINKKELRKTSLLFKTKLLIRNSTDKDAPLEL